MTEWFSCAFKAQFFVVLFNLYVFGFGNLLIRKYIVCAYIICAMVASSRDTFHEHRNHHIYFFQLKKANANLYTTCTSGIIQSKYVGNISLFISYICVLFATLLLGHVEYITSVQYFYVYEKPWCIVCFEGKVRKSRLFWCIVLYGLKISVIYYFFCNRHKNSW